jgi:hypothetical protein
MNKIGLYAMKPQALHCPDSTYFCQSTARESRKIDERARRSIAAALTGMSNVECLPSRENLGRRSVSYLTRRWVRRI